MNKPLLSDETILERALLLANGDLVPNWAHGYRCGGVWVRDEYEPELAKLTAERDDLKAKLEIAVDALELGRKFFVTPLSRMLCLGCDAQFEEEHEFMCPFARANDALAKIRGTG